jgi:methyltransferase
MVTFVPYAILVLLVVVERIAELVVSERHARWMIGHGGVEHGRGHYPPMVALHTALLAGCLLEPLVLRRPFVPALGLPMLAAVVLAQALRWWAIRSLGVRWSTRVIVMPHASRVARGPYRVLSHPNYVAVVVEGIALPLVHSAWITAIAFTVMNAVLLAVRISVEDHALDAAEAS